MVGGKELTYATSATGAIVKHMTINARGAVWNDIIDWREMTFLTDLRIPMTINAKALAAAAAQSEIDPTAVSKKKQLSRWAHNILIYQSRGMYINLILFMMFAALGADLSL